MIIFLILLFYAKRTQPAFGKAMTYRPMRGLRSRFLTGVSPTLFRFLPVRSMLFAFYKKSPPLNELRSEFLKRESFILTGVKNAAILQLYVRVIFLPVPPFLQPLF